LVTACLINMDPIITAAGVAVFFFFLWWRKHNKSPSVEMTTMEIDDDPMDLVDGYDVDPMEIDSGDEADVDERDGIIVSKLRTINLFYNKNK